MTLGPHSQMLLTSVAEAIVHGRQAKMNLQHLASEGATFYQEGPTYLIRKVHELSAGVFTLRVADRLLFDQLFSVNALFLVRCVKEEPEGEVTSLGEGMALVYVGTYSDGYRFNMAVAPEAKVQERRALAAQAEAEATDIKAAYDAAGIEVEQIVKALRQRIFACDDAGIIADIRLELHLFTNEVPLQTIIAYCKRLRINWLDLVKVEVP